MKVSSLGIFNSNMMEVREVTIFQKLLITSRENMQPLLKLTPCRKQVSSTEIDLCHNNVFKQIHFCQNP